MKKIISLLLCLAVLSCTFSVCAESPVTLSATVGKSDSCIGDTIEVVISLSAYSNACAGTIDLSYNDEVLKFLSYKKCSAFDNIYIEINPNISKNKIRNVWFGLKSPGGGEAIKLTFECIGAGNADLKFDFVELVDANINFISYSATAETLTVHDDVEILSFENPGEAVVWSSDSKDVYVAFVCYDSSQNVSDVSFCTESLVYGNNTLYPKNYDTDGATRFKVIVLGSLSSLVPLCRSGQLVFE